MEARSDALPSGQTGIQESDARYREIFDGARVALWDQDFSPLLDLLDAFRARGVTDLRGYLESRPEELAKAVRLVQVRDINSYAVELFEAGTKQELLGALGATFLPETQSVFLNEMIALWEGKRRFESEAAVRTLKGRRLDILLTIAWGGERCERSLVSILDISKQKASGRRLEMLNSIGRTLSSDLDLERIVQAVTDSATKLSGARFGAFFYNVIDNQGERLLLYTLSGAPRAAFEKFGLPRNTAVFDPTFRGTGIMRSDDITKDARYGQSAPHHGMPKGHLPVVSYLAVPVVSRSGEVIGGLFFGHDQPGVFTAESEEIVAGIAAHAAIAIDNARLLRSAQNEIDQRRLAERALAKRGDEQTVLFQLTDRLHRAHSLSDVYDSAMDAILRAMGCDRVSILLFDEENVMRFVAWRGLSDDYRQAVEGHSPWTADARDPQPICMDDIDGADLPADLKARIKAERIGALAFIPLSANGRLIGKFMTYYRSPHAFSSSELDLAVTIARQLGYSLSRLRAEHAGRRAERALRESQQRLELALDAGRMGAWEWNTTTGKVAWSPSLEELHGREPGSFRGTFDDFKRDIHPEDVEMVLGRIQQALQNRSDHHVVYRVVHRDGTIRWLEAFGQFVPGSEGQAHTIAGVCMDITERKRAEEALRERGKELESIIDRTPFMLTRCGNDLTYRFVSRAYSRMIGRPPEEITGMKIVDILGEEGFKTILPHVRKVLQGERVEYESEVTLSGAGKRYLHVVYVPEFDEQGGVSGWISSIVDITARKRAEDQRDLLVTELSHRVNNTLATVVSIARQSFAKGGSVESARRSFDGRIRALAQTHGRLAEGNWSGVSFDKMLLDELAPYRRDDGANVRVSGPGITLNPKCAVVLGMAMHELATNAAKYGALSTKNGLVSVNWEIEPQGRQLRINWTESGGPAVAPPSRSGFGRLLLEQALSSDLRGDVRLDFAESGLRCDIVLPMETHTAPAN